MKSDYKEISLENTAEDLAQWAKEGKRLLILSHRSPDGDTLGSAFALKIIYNALSGSAFCACQSDAAPYLRFLYAEQETIVYTEDLEKDYDKIIAVDIASPSQLGNLVHLAEKTDLLLDHHGIGEIFADNYVDPVASAVGEIIFELYEILIGKGEIKRLPEACMRMYAAISSDTGSFKYSNTTEKTHVIAGKLISELNIAGIEHAEIARILHDSHSMTDLKAQKLAIDNLQIECDGAFAYVFLTVDMLKAEELSDENTGGIVDIPRSVEDVLVGVSIKQSFDDENEYRISSRSNCDIDVAEICSLFGGGGHKKAAGGRLVADSSEKARAEITQAFKAAVLKYREEHHC